jgi:hypothetical protein
MKSNLIRALPFLLIVANNVFAISASKSTAAQAKLYGTNCSSTKNDTFDECTWDNVPFPFDKEKVEQWISTVSSIEYLHALKCKNDKCSCAVDDAVRVEGFYEHLINETDSNGNQKKINMTVCLRRGTVAEKKNCIHEFECKADNNHCISNCQRNAKGCGLKCTSGSRSRLDDFNNLPFNTIVLLTILVGPVLISSLLIPSS